MFMLIWERMEIWFLRQSQTFESWLIRSPRRAASKTLEQTFSLATQGRTELAFLISKGFAHTPGIRSWMKTEGLEKQKALELVGRQADLCLSFWCRVSCSPARPSNLVYCWEWPWTSNHPASTTQALRHCTNTWLYSICESDETDLQKNRLDMAGWYMSLIPACLESDAADLCEFMASPIYITTSRPVRATLWDFSRKKNKSTELVNWLIS